MDFTDTVKQNKVLKKDPLFRDGNKILFEIKYAYNSYYFTAYYDPDPSLAEYLERLQCFMDNRKAFYELCKEKQKQREKVELVLMGLFLIFLKKCYNYQVPF
ncbi:MAG: hypothetical protein ACTSR8_12015 [Promethearchaeota archaeon]